MALVEKRIYRTRSQCPKKLENYVLRATTERFLLLKKPSLREDWEDEIQKEEEHCEETKTAAKIKVCPVEFAIAGSTGNCYVITLDTCPTCTCPYFQKGDICKHIMFVLFKVVGVPRRSSIWYQRAYLTQELREIYQRLESSLENGNIKIASKEIRKAHRQSLSSPYMPGARCTVCHGRLVQPDTTVCCPSSRCGGIFHYDCLTGLPNLGRLSLHQTNNVRTTYVTCPCCETEWEHDEGCINLARVTGQTPIRDKSTYRSTPGYPDHSGYRKYGY